MYKYWLKESLNVTINEICTHLQNNHFIQQCKPSFSFFKRTGSAAIKAAVYQRCQVAITDLKKLILHSEGGFEKINTIVISLKASIMLELSQDIPLWTQNREQLNNLFEQITNLYRMDNLDEHFETDSLGSHSSGYASDASPPTQRKFPATESLRSEKTSFIEIYTQAIKEILLAGDIEKSFTDCTRMDLKINNYPFDRNLKNKVQSISNQGHITQQAINYLRQFYLNHGFTNLLVADY